MESNLVLRKSQMKMFEIDDGRLRSMETVESTSHVLAARYLRTRAGRRRKVPVAIGGFCFLSRGVNTVPGR